MALQTLNRMWVGPVTGFSAAAPVFTSFLLDAAAEKVAVVFRVPVTGTLNTFGIRLGTVGVVPLNGLRFSFQDVNVTTGDPDGTQDQFRDVIAGIATDAWLQAGLITSDGTDLGTKRSVTRGDVLCAVVEYATFIALDSTNIQGLAVTAAVSSSIFPSMPYIDHFTAAWATSAVTRPILALQYSDGSYAYIGGHVYPIHGLNATSYNSASTTADHIGLRFQVPVPLKLSGAWVRLDLDGDANVVVYDTDGTSALATSPMDADVEASSAGAGRYVLFPSDVTLTKNATYRVSVNASSTANLSIYDFDIASSGYIAACDGGAEWAYTSRVDSTGAWAENYAKRPWMALEFTAADDGVSGTVASTPVGLRQAGPRPRSRRGSAVGLREQIHQQESTRAWQPTGPRPRRRR